MVRLPSPRAALALLVLVVPILAVAGCGGGGGAATGPQGGEAKDDAAVKISNYTYRPAVVTVREGGRVTWANDDEAPHTATADDAKTFDTGSLKPGSSKTVTLGKPGTYTYHCSFHRFMVARVVVK